MRVLFWVQHLLGSGHLRRALTVAEALAARNHEVTLISGGMPMPWAIDRRLDFVQLPPVRAKDASFALILDETGHPVSELVRDRRRRVLLERLEEVRPHAVLTEMFPFGRGGFRSELLPLLERSRTMALPPKVAASVRDVLVTKADARKTARMVETALAFYDRIFVHGAPHVIAVKDSFPLADRLGGLVEHTGFVTAPADGETSGLRDEILISAGGGAVGERLLNTAARARPYSRNRNLVWRIVTGVNLPAAAALKLQRLGGGGIVIDRHHESLVPLLRRAAVSVSQAGYNTVVEALATRTPMVLVPFAEAGEDEQTIRATKIAGFGAGEHLPDAELDPRGLAGAIDRVRDTAPSHSKVSLDGAVRTVVRLEALVDGGGE